MQVVLKCNNFDTEVNYADAILRDVLTRGLYDSEIQLELLGDQNQNMTLEQVFKFVEAKEAGRHSASKIMDSQGAESASSSCRRSKNADPLKVDKPKVETHEVCSYCGKTGHGVWAPTRIRQKECVAYGQTCPNCTLKNHLPSMCRISKSTNKKHTSKHEGAVFNSLCIAMDYNSSFENKVIYLDHNVYDNLNNAWSKKSSQPQLYVNVSVETKVEDYKSLGYASNFPSKPREITVSAMADTGCQSCLAGIKIAHRLGLNERILIPVTLKMHAANNRNIKILGATVLVKCLKRAR